LHGAADFTQGLNVMIYYVLVPSFCGAQSQVSLGRFGF
jgi:hypothetical protein